MNISTTARHCELDTEVRAFALQRMERFQKFAQDVSEARLVVTLEKYRYIAEITVRVNQHELASRDEATDARSAVDGAAGQIDAQLRRLKERRVERRRSVTDPAADVEADGDSGDSLAAEG